MGTSSVDLISVFYDLKAALDSVDRAILWLCLSLKGVPGEFVPIFQFLCSTEAEFALTAMFHPSSLREVVFVVVVLSQLFH